MNPWGSNRGFMPNLNKSVGQETPSWAVNSLGNGTFQGPANAGSNNGYIGPINGQSMGGHMRPKAPQMNHSDNSTVGTTPGSYGVDAFGFPIMNQGQASGAGLNQLNAYRDYNQAVQAWIDKTGFTGEGGYGAFQLANPNWVSQYGPMNAGGLNGQQSGIGGQGGGFGSGQPWSPGPNFGQMPNAQGQMVPSIGNPTPGASGQPGPPRLPPQTPPPGGAGTSMGIGKPVNYGSGTTMPSTPSAPTGLQQGQNWGGNGQR
jgi:hypothetical protein